MELFGNCPVRGPQSALAVGNEFQNLELKCSVEANRFKSGPNDVDFSSSRAFKLRLVAAVLCSTMWVCGERVPGSPIANG